MQLMLPCKKESYRHSEGVKLCKKKDEVSLLSVEALHQLHIFIFILGLFHVVFCATTILLGGAKIRKWKHWETGIHQEIEHKLKQVEASPAGIVCKHQGEFISERTKGFWMKLAVGSWIIAFLRQFHDSVNKSDYKALRSAFGLRHCPNHPYFDFHKYMVRALKHDFKRVVGISWYLWLFVIFFLSLNINGWHTYFWLAFLPLFLLLLVGAKLEHIITRLAQEAAAVALSEGVPNIKPSKEHFWFGKPEIVLQLIHFILFQNSFEIGFFFWVLVTYGFDSCIMEKKVYAISRLVIGVLIQVICSYVTLPLYAIVTHMDGGIKLQGIASGLHEHVTKWALGARKKEQSRVSVPNAATLRGTGRAGDGARATEVEAAGTCNSYEHYRGSPRNVLSPPPDLDEIVSVAVEDGGGENHHRR
uniref:MLO-like protein n=1 Tax=Oryza coarctata TaxID=77588 RepID=C0JAB2_ORYCO|nr:Mlo family protein [Oryza coarctata]